MTTPDQPDILQTLDKNITFMEQQLKGTRGNLRKECKNWIETMKEVRELAASRELTQEHVERMVRQGCIMTGATPAKAIQANGEPEVWITMNDTQEAQVTAIHSLGEKLHEEIESWSPD